MAIREAEGDLLKANVDALVNTVNCVGVMGKGIALQFKRRYPDMFKDYASACRSGQVGIGKIHVFQTGALHGPQYILNFPTKKHWRSPSKLEYIEAGLKDLVSVTERLGVTSIALPPLGAGNGGLHWPDVRSLIDAAFANTELDVLLHEPSQARRTVDPVSRIRMTPGRALVLALIGGYEERRRAVEPWEEGVSHLEVQKLMYFADVYNPDLGLDFEPARYGPYSDRVRHLLVGMEGTYISGFGDGSRQVLTLDPIHVTDRGSRELAAYLSTPEGREIATAVERVLTMTEGYEGPYGVELLASAYFAARRTRSLDPAQVAPVVRGWTRRKSRLFSDRHIESALSHLEDVVAAV